MWCSWSLTNALWQEDNVPCMHSHFVVVQCLIKTLLAEVYISKKVGALLLNFLHLNSEANLMFSFFY